LRREYKERQKEEDRSRRIEKEIKKSEGKLRR